MIYTEFTYNHGDGFWYGADFVSPAPVAYLMNFEDILENDHILSMTIDVTGITLDNSAHDLTTVQLLLSGAVVGVNATVSVSIWTNKARNYTREFKLQVVAA